MLNLRALLALNCLATLSLAQPSTRPVGPPAEAGAKAALDSSPRHGEWADVTLGAGQAPVRCWVVYPEVKDKAPVVILIQEIFGLSDWLRATADQCAADGFIAVAPDLLSGRGPNGGGTDSFAGRDAVTKAVRDIRPDDAYAMLDAVTAFGQTLPAASGKTAVVGFCWGGGMSYGFAAHRAGLHAAVVCYGAPPKGFDAKAVQCPVLGLFGGDDARVTSTVPAAESAMKAAGRTYAAHVYDGAGHGFFRQQDGKNGANRKAVDEGWPSLITFLKENTK